MPHYKIVNDVMDNFPTPVGVSVLPGFSVQFSQDRI